MTSPEASMLFDTLRASNSTISYVNLGFNKNLDDLCMKSIGEYIKWNKSIQKIHVNSNQISDAGIDILCPYLDGNTSFKQMIFRGNKRISNKSIPKFIKMIESSFLEHVGIEETSITEKNILVAPLACGALKYATWKLNLTFKYVLPCQFFLLY